MNPPIDTMFHAVDLGLLRCASLLVDRNQRAIWIQEWDSELWHVRRACIPPGPPRWMAERRVLLFCLGAFQDAFCVLRLRHKRRAAPASLQGSALQCLLQLAGVLAIAYALACILPGVRVESHPSLYQIRSGLVLLQNALFTDNSAATINGRQFMYLKTSRQRGIDGLAFYRINKEAVSPVLHATRQWGVAHASSNLFALLGSPIHFIKATGEQNANLPGVVLSEELWMREFGANPSVVGRVVRVGRMNARVEGVLPRGSWRLPGAADAWLLEQDAAISPGAVGYAVGHLTHWGVAEMYDERLHINAYDPDDPGEDLWGVSFAERTRGPGVIFQFAILLAFLALPAITSVSLGEYSFCSHKPPWQRKFFRWIFLSAKIAFLLSIAYFLSLDLSYWHATAYSSASEYAQLFSSFLICLLGMRWVLLDQRQRCPVCLRRVTHPAQVGQASRTFLAWNGTELICTSGHTLLHVPGLPTSWFGTQRWLYLDTSWEFLFASSGVG
jgi:hypothetical protein